MARSSKSKADAAAALIGGLPDDEEAGENPAEEAGESPEEEAREESQEPITVEVPVDLLSQDGVPPEEGDTVSAQIDATVQSVSDSMATLSIDAINGEPVGSQTGNTTGGPISPPPGGPGGGPGGPPPGPIGPGPAVPSPGLAAMRARLARGALANRLGIGM